MEKIVLVVKITNILTLKMDSVQNVLLEHDIILSIMPVLNLPFTPTLIVLDGLQLMLKESNKKIRNCKTMEIMLNVHSRHHSSMAPNVFLAQAIKFFPLILFLVQNVQQELNLT